MEFARDLSNQFNKLVVDEEKSRKKLLKKEQLEKSKGEVQRLSYIIDIQVCRAVCF